MKSPGSGTDQSNGQADGLTGLRASPNALDSTETTGMSHGDGASTYLEAGGARHGVSSRHKDVPGIGNDISTTADEVEDVKIS